MTVGIVGLGMIGGSIGLALRDPSRKIVGYDPSKSNAQVANERACVDLLAELPEVCEADVIFIAAPPRHVVGILEEISSLRPPTTFVTDCTSVKADAVAWASGNHVDWFVGGHPMAGHEKSGPAFASAWMFRNARWVLTPDKQTSPKAIKAVEALIKDMGAVPVRSDAGDHDRHVATLSHLPHIFAAILVMLGEEIPRTDIAGGSWRDLTRVGGVDPNLWTQILMANRAELINVIRQSESQLADVRVALESEDAGALQKMLHRAQTAKRKQEK